MRVIQFTDTHIVADPGQKIFGVDTYEALRFALKEALALDPLPDAIFVTGDLAEDGSLLSYNRFRDIFSDTKIPVFVVPGNHDDTENMAASFSNSSVNFESHVRLGEWSVVFVNSQTPKNSHGEITDSEWAKIENILKGARGRPTLLALHHPPQSPCPSTGCQMKDANAFLNRLCEHPYLKLIVSGHLHQEIKSKFCAYDNTDVTIDLRPRKIS